MRTATQHKWDYCRKVRKIHSDAKCTYFACNFLWNQIVWHILESYCLFLHLLFSKGASPIILSLILCVWSIPDTNLRVINNTFIQPLISFRPLPFIEPAVTAVDSLEDVRCVTVHHHDASSRSFSHDFSYSSDSHLAPSSDHSHSFTGRPRKNFLSEFFSRTYQNTSLGNSVHFGHFWAILWQ